MSLPHHPNYHLPPLTTQPADGGLNATICPGDSAQLGVADTSGGKVIFTWSPTTGLSDPDISNPKASPSVTTTYYLTATDTTLGTSCAAFTDSVTVTVRSSVQPANAGPDQTICLGDSIQLGIPPAADVVYAWSPATGLSDPAAAQPKASPISTTTYILTTTDTLAGAGCAIFTDTVTVTVQTASPINNAGSDQVICIGDSIMIGLPDNSGGTANFAWTPSAGLNDTSVAQPLASPAMTTTYYLILTDSTWASACKTSIDTVTLTVEIPAQTAGAGPEQIICTGDSTMIGTPDTSGGKATFSWWPFIDMADSSAATTMVFPLATRTYFLTVTDTSLNTCPASQDTITITVEQPIQQQQAPSPFTICPDEAVEIGIAPQPDQTYTWSPTLGLDNPNASLTYARPDQTTIYTLTVTDTTKVTSNCRSYQSAVQVFVEDCEVEIPNVITPNGDGHNDYFVIRNIRPNTQLSIFNRWGVEIYSSGNYRNDWPEDQDWVKTGVYFYVVKEPEGEAKRGSFTVLR